MAKGKEIEPAGPGKPEYSSPFRYRILDQEAIWKRIRQGADASPLAIGSGVDGVCSNLEAVLSPDGRLSFNVFLFKNYGRVNLKSAAAKGTQPEALEATLREYVDDTLRVRGYRLYQVLGCQSNEEGNQKQVGDLIFHPFRYLPLLPVSSSEEFSQELERGLKILRIFITQTYRNSGIKIPPKEIVISSEAVKTKSEAPSAVKTSESLEELRRAIIVEKRPDVTFAEVGGQPVAVNEARQLADQLKSPWLFRNWGIEPPRGILFYGEPGNGKTLIAKAIATESASAFLHVRACDLASKWYGDIEKLTHQVFLIAAAEVTTRGHCIIFLDEVDSLISSRQEETHEATRKMIGTFLQEIDGLQTREGITVVASTNDLAAVDQAFLSRMTKWIKVPPPDAEGLGQIFAIHFQRASQKAGRELIAVPNFSTLARKLVGISGRDVADIVQITLEAKAQQELNGLTPSLVTEADIGAAIQTSSKIQDAIRKHKKETPLGFTHTVWQSSNH